MTPVEALETCERIQSLIEDDVPGWAHDKALDFFEDVMEKVGDVAETIEQTQSVTTRQAAALEGWEAGVRKWIR